MKNTIEKYRQMIQTVKKDAIPLAVIFCVLVLLVFAGMYSGIEFPELKQFFAESKNYYFRHNLLKMIAFIVLKNLLACFLLIGLGVTVVFPYLSMLINSFFVGYVLKMAIGEAGSHFVVLKLIPHGIFEIPAYCLASLYGIRIGISIFRKNRAELIRQNYGEGMGLLFFIIAPLIVVAGVIEGTLIWFGV